MSIRGQRASFTSSMILPRTWQLKKGEDIVRSLEGDVGVIV
jgi:hypothetical protein